MPNNQIINLIYHNEDKLYPVDFNLLKISTLNQNLTSQHSHFSIGKKTLLSMLL